MSKNIDAIDAADEHMIYQLPLAGMTGRRMDRRHWNAWYEGVFDAMEEAERVHASGARLPPDDNEMFWAWAHESFERQGHYAAQEVIHAIEEEEIWLDLWQRSYARGYGWALHVELLRLNFGSSGVTPEDRAAYDLERRSFHGSFFHPER